MMATKLFECDSKKKNVTTMEKYHQPRRFFFSIDIGWWNEEQNIWIFEFIEWRSNLKEATVSKWTKKWLKVAFHSRKKCKSLKRRKNKPTSKYTHFLCYILDVEKNHIHITHFCGFFCLDFHLLKQEESENESRRVKSLSNEICCQCCCCCLFASFLLILPLIWCASGNFFFCIHLHVLQNEEKKKCYVYTHETKRIFLSVRFGQMSVLRWWLHHFQI